MIEFDDDTPDETPDEEILDGGRPPVRRWIRVATATVLALVVGVAVVLTLRGEDRSQRRAAPAPSTVATQAPQQVVVTAGPHGNPCQSTPDGREMCFLDHLPRAVRTAVRDVFPNARLVTNYAGIIDPDGRLLDRQLSVDAGERKLSIHIVDGDVTRRPYRVQAAPGVRITSLDTAIPNGRHVYIEVIDQQRKAVPRAVLERLAHDRRLLAIA